MINVQRAQIDIKLPIGNYQSGVTFYDLDNFVSFLDAFDFLNDNYVIDYDVT